MLIRKRPSTYIDRLPSVALRSDKLILGVPRKAVAGGAASKLLLPPKTLELIEKLKGLGYEPYVNPQTGWVMAATNLVGINICLNPEKSNFNISLRNPMGHKVGQQAQICKDPRDIKRFVDAAGIKPTSTKDVGRTENLIATNNANSSTRGQEGATLSLGGSKGSKRSLWNLGGLLRR